MKNKLIIAGVIAVAVIGVAAFIVTRQPEAPVVPEMPVVNDEVKPEIKEEVKEITKNGTTFTSKLTEYCRKVITKNQLQEVTNYQGEFFFVDIKEEDPIYGVMEMCVIVTEAEKIIIMIGISNLNFETVMQRITNDPDVRMMLSMAEKLDNVGEKAKIITTGGIHTVMFSDGDIDRLVKVIVQGELAREAIIEFAKQVEASIR